MIFRPEPTRQSRKIISLAQIFKMLNYSLAVYRIKTVDPF
jgi:hypothetical protein